MFNYFGSKRTFAIRYPKPRYPTVIEPFCGAAGYSLLYKEKTIWINDYWPLLTDVWRWILTATPGEIAALPELKEGEYVTDHDLTRPQRNLLRWTLNFGSSHTGTNRCHRLAVERQDCRKLKQRLYDLCPQIRHWKLTNLDYRKIPNKEATWFIDPPYQKEGKLYKHHNIDYQELAQWCLARKGQIIVCESPFATWLPFKLLFQRQGRGGIFVQEHCYTN